MYSFTNKVINSSGFNIYCAYSAPDPAGGDDIWCVGLLKSVDYVEGIDIDYIRAAADKNTLCFYINSQLMFKTAGWVKIRQMVTTNVCSDDKDSNNGILVPDGTWPGVPNDALREAKKYDNSFFSKNSRGTAAVKNAIAEWEQIIAGSQVKQL